jgi:hypothetical protein
MIEILQQVQHYKRQPISKDQFNEWKRDPVTEALLLDLAESLLDQIDEDLPEDLDKSVIIAHQREGARKMLQVLVDWSPEFIKEDDDD